MTFATLRLFNCVPASNGSGYEFLPEYGVVIAPTAVHKSSEIKVWLNEELLSGHQLNSSFHKSWEKVANAPDFQLRLEQLVHYLSTYGMDFLGVYSDEYIYIPEEVLNLPEKVGMKVIYGVPDQELVTRCLELLAQGVALKQETIQDILGVLDVCGYQFTGQEIINNREAQVLITDKTGVLPSDPDALFRYLYYKVTCGETLVIKNQKIFELIEHGCVNLPHLTEKQMIGLAGSFNRRKPLWMSMKRASQDNIPVINKISKLSKIYHRPLKPNVLLSLTSEEFTDEEVQQAASQANIFQIIRAVNALRLYQCDQTNRYYRIRNGKGWARTKESNLTEDSLVGYELVLLENLQSRLKDVSIYCPPHVSYALPTSEKQFVGNIPRGTRFSMSSSEEFLLFGIYWEGSRVDLDLRADSVNASVGWNSSYRDTNRGLMYSGDVTSSPYGATEWMYCKEIDSPYLIKVNGYQMGDEQPYKILLGRGSDISKNYVIDPSKVILEAPAVMDQREVLMGIVEPSKTGVDYYLVAQGSGSARIGGYGERSQIIQTNLVHSFQSMLRLDDFMTFASLEDADVNLDPKALNKDSILGLFQG